MSAPRAVSRFWWYDAPVGVLGIGAGIVGAALSVAWLHLPGWVGVLDGMALGLVAQVALTNLLYAINDRVKERLRPDSRVDVEVSDGSVLVRICHDEVPYAAAALSPDEAMQTARSLVGAALELDQGTEQRIDLH